MLMIISNEDDVIIAYVCWWGGGLNEPRGRENPIHSNRKNCLRRNSPHLQFSRVFVCKLINDIRFDYRRASHSLSLAVSSLSRSFSLLALRSRIGD